MPTKNEVHIDAPLTNISIAYMQDSNNFVADKVFPRVPVAKQSDLYWLYDKSDFLRDEMEIMADATESAGGDYSVSATSSYRCPVRALHKKVGDQERANTDSPLQTDTDATIWLTQKAMINKDRNFAANFLVTGVWGTTVTPGTLWDATNSTPIEDIETAKGTIMSSTGQRPNKIVMGYNVFKALMHHADILDRIKYNFSGDIATIGEPALASLFGVSEVLVMHGVYDPAVEGATSAPVFIGDNECLVCFTTTAPSLRTPSAGYNFIWTGMNRSDGLAILRFRNDENHYDKFEIQYAWDQKIVAADCGYLFLNVVA